MSAAPPPVLPALALLSALASGPAAASVLKLDGIPDEPIWHDAQVFDDFRITNPYTLGPPTHATVARLLALPEGLAVAFVCDQPAGTPRVKPRANRDGGSNADRVNFAVDLDGDGRLAYNFMVTLGNAIGDEVITNENQYNADWDGVWRHALHEGEDRWSVEMLIPWSVAAMREGEGAERSIAVYFDRVIAARNERSAAPHASYTRPRFVSEFARVQVPRHRGGGVLAIVPYSSVQYDLLHDRGEGRAGLDLFWKPSGRFQLSAALNPDFGQVEADDLVVNFDAIEVFFSDKRPFFTENQGIFNVTTPDSGRLVYTRRIGGGRDDGEGAADIDAAIKLNGSAGGFDYGTLVAIESGHADDIGRAFFVQRLVRNLGNATLGYLGTWTDRPWLDREAQVHAIDAIWRPSAKWLVSGQVLGSSIEQGGETRNGSGAWFRAFYTPEPRFQHELEITHFDRRLDFNDVGYQRRGNLNELEWTSTYRQTGFGDDDWRRSITWAVEPQVRYNDSGDRLPPELLLTANVSLREGGTLYSDLLYAWRGHDDLVSRGHGKVELEPRLRSFYNYYESPRVGRWLWFAGVYVTQEGNEGFAIQPELIARYFIRDDLNVRLQFFPRWSQDWLIWREDTLFASYRRKQQRLDLDVNWFPGSRHELRLKAQWLGIDAYDPTAYRIGAGGRLLESGDSVPAFTSNTFGVQLRYRYEFAPQRELYVVYARGGDERTVYEDGHPRDSHDGLGGLFADIPDLRDADQVLVKLRWAF
jgi:hypothetical protein